MKRRIVILLLLSVVVSFVAIPVFAQGNADTHRETVIPPGTEIEIIIPPDISGTYDLDKGDTQQNVEEAKEYAYFDPDQFDLEMKEKIIDARTTIIFNSDGWVADGFRAEVTDAAGNNTSLPSFSELFPGWDLPVDKEISNGDFDLSQIPHSDEEGWHIPHGYGYRILNKPLAAPVMFLHTVSSFFQIR